jgi:hypothetical protein
MKRIQKINKGERGQSLVEMAISLIIILLLLVGAVEFSIALYQFVAMRDAAQEGALYGSIHPDETDVIVERVKAAASDVLPLNDGDVVVTINGAACEGLTGGVPNSIKVTVNFGHVIFMPLVTPIIGTDTINLSANVTDTILYQCPS